MSVKNHLHNSLAWGQCTEKIVLLLPNMTKLFYCIWGKNVTGPKNEFVGLARISSAVIIHTIYVGQTTPSVDGLHLLCSWTVSEKDGNLIP